MPLIYSTTQETPSDLDEICDLSEPEDEQETRTLTLYRTSSFAYISKQEPVCRETTDPNADEAQSTGWLESLC